MSCLVRVSLFTWDLGPHSLLDQYDLYGGALVTLGSNNVIYGGWGGGGVGVGHPVSARPLEGLETEVSHTEGQPCLCDTDSTKTLDTKAG